MLGEGFLFLKDMLRVFTSFALLRVLDLITILTNEGGAVLLFRIGSFSVSVCVCLCALTVAADHSWPTTAAVGPGLVQPSGQSQFEHR